MGDKTGIEWTDATWNPTTGCDRVSPGCDHCYAMTLAPRLKAMGSPHYQTDGSPATSGPGFGIAMHPDGLDKPLRWTRPRRIFVNSMSDLFHDGVTPEFQADVFAVMTLAHWHTFQVLTKRPGVMRSRLRSTWFPLLVAQKAAEMSRAHKHRTLGPEFTWPLPNVWMGTSVEDQKRADLRIPALLGTPTAVRFLSMEPLLGPVTLCNCYPGGVTPESYEGVQEHCTIHGRRGVDWIIVGGESGPGARPMHPDWVRNLRDEAEHAPGVAFHFKQWGSHDEHGIPVHKKVAGRLLDGRTWDEFPPERA